MSELASDEYDRLIEAATDYLRSIGAHPVVIGGAGIMQSVDLKLNHYLTVKWSGQIPPTIHAEGERE